MSKLLEVSHWCFPLALLYMSVSQECGALWCLEPHVSTAKLTPSLHYFKTYELVNFWSIPQRPVNTYFSIYSWNSLWKPFVHPQILDAVYLKFFFLILIFFLNFTNDSERPAGTVTCLSLQKCDERKMALFPCCWLWKQLCVG